MPILVVLQTAFFFWMLYDAVQRRAEYYWYIIIFIPFGEWLYFFAVKMKDPEWRRFRAALSYSPRPPSVERLQYRAERSPSHQNLLSLAQRLLEEGKYEEAGRAYESVLHKDDACKDALWGIARCLIALERHEEAREFLEDLVGHKPSYLDFAAYRRLVTLLDEMGETEAAIETAGRLVRTADRLAHRLLHAELLSKAGLVDQARSQIEQGIAEYREAPAFDRRRERSVLRDAERMLKEL